MIFQEIHQSTKIKIIQLRETETTRIIDHGTTPTVDHTTAITTMNSVITLGIETTTIQTDKKNYFLSTHRNNNPYSASQSQNYRNSTPKHQRQINQVEPTDETYPDPPGIENTEILEIQFNHIHCETTDEKSDAENTLLTNMLHIKNEYETPNNSNYYQNNTNTLILKSQITIQIL